MNVKSSLFAGIVVCALLLTAFRAFAAPPVRTNLFSTGFEYLEGFDTQFLLDDQNGWIHLPIDTNGVVLVDLPADGIVTNQFDGLGQQAWIGGEFVTNAIDQVFLWHPTILDPVPTATPIVKFSVLMAIQDSTFQKFDFFRWSVYNSQTNRLFSIDFDNFDFTMAFQLDDGNFQNIPLLFSPNVPQQLEISMHFAANQWSAWLDGTQIVANAAITTTSQNKTLGQIRALWLPSDPENPGDNRMVFDNFSLSAESVPTVPIPPTLLTLGRTSDGSYALRLNGENGSTYVLDYSEDSTTWFPIKTNITFDGSFDYVDTNAPVLPQRIFRARLLSE